MIVDKIPYFGEHTYLFVDKLRCDLCKDVVTYASMPEFIYYEGTKRNNVIVIDDGTILKLAYVKDAVFNYRDREAFIPYFDYNIKKKAIPTKVKAFKQAHLLLNIDHTKWLLRYNFKLKKLKLAPTSSNKPYKVFDPSTGKQYYVYITKWYDKTFEMDELWAHYINSAYKEEDHLLGGYEPGYTYIAREFPGFHNYEHTIRKSLDLPTFDQFYTSDDHIDVRSYRYAELFGKEINFNYRPYKIRRLVFDCMLYSVIQAGAIPTDEKTAKRYKKLQEMSCIMCYAPSKTDPPLIFKSYWFGVGNYADKKLITTKV